MGDREFGALLAATICGFCHFMRALMGRRIEGGGSMFVPPPPLVVPHPLSFPRGWWGTVTWSTQNFSLRLIVLLCG